MIFKRIIVYKIVHAKYTERNEYSIFTSHYTHSNITYKKIIVEKTNMEILLTINI